MQRILLCALLCAASLSAATPAFAWMTEPARNPDNGHYYAFFNGADDERLSAPVMTFADALTRAASMSHLGIRGHLATITSQVEQDFVVQYFWDFGTRLYPHNFWIAGSDAVVEGEWRWVAGPEEGQVFWQGSADLRGHVTGQSFGYENWRKSSSGSTIFEPNNQPMNLGRNPEGEDYLALSVLLQGALLPSYWNDVIGVDDRIDFSPRLAIVEFSVPEPSSGALIASAGSIRVAACRRKSAARR